MPPGGLNIRSATIRAGPGSAPARFQARRHARLRAREQAQPHQSLRRAQAARSASSPPARAISTSARRSTSSASTKSNATSSASGSTRSAARGRSSPPGLRSSRAGLDLIIVVEEKRSLIEVQVREELYGTANQPVCIGKKDEQGNWLFPVKGALDPNDVAICIGERLLEVSSQRRPGGARGAAEGARSASLAETEDIAVAHSLFLLRLPAQYLDRGAGGHARLCRHRLPLHGASGWTARPTASPRWAARARTGSARRRSPSALTSSRISATAPIIIPARWRCAVADAAGVNITYKILFNDAVAMTGGQRHDGGLTVPQDRAPGGGRGRARDRRRDRRAGQISGRHLQWPAGLADQASRRP